MNKRMLSAAGKAALGANMKAARKKAGMDQGAAAASSGVGRPLISQWETGIYAPNADGLLRLAIAYDCSLDDFFGGVDERYDAIIERRIPPDAAKLFRAKLERIKALTLNAIELTAEAAEAGEPRRAQDAEHLLDRPLGLLLREEDRLDRGRRRLAAARCAEGAPQ